MFCKGACIGVLFRHDAAINRMPLVHLVVNPRTIMSENLKEITEEELDAKHKEFWQKAQNNYNIKNYTYTISLCQVILKEYPAFLDGRRLARTSAVAENTGKKQKKGLFGSSGLKLPSNSKKDPLAAMIDLEEALAKSPADGGANDMLFECAQRVGLLETAAFALETVCSGSPENTKLLHKLADFYLAREMPGAAAKVYTAICEEDPTDMIAVKGSKDATARASMKNQNWENAQDIKELMKDSGETADLESANRAAMTKEQLKEKLAKLSAEYAQDNQNLSLVKDIGEIYEQLEDWPNAHSFYNYAYSLSNKDVALRSKAGKMKDKAADFHVEQVKAAYEADPENAELKAQYDEITANRTENQVAEAELRVERNPTDPQLRYDLGLALYNAGQHSEAIPHLQQATRNPHIRTKVLLLLGRTFKAKNMNDLAIKQLSDALEDLPSMDDTKKEVLYEKGLIHSDTGDAAGALASFKQIYEVDYGYKDVAQRVESSYTG